MNKAFIISLLVTFVTAGLTNKEVNDCIIKKSMQLDQNIPLYAEVECAHFIKQLTNFDAYNEQADESIWTSCKNRLEKIYSQTLHKQVFLEMDSCYVSKDKFDTSSTLMTEKSSLIDCVNSIPIPRNLLFQYKNSVNCDKFRNELASQSTMQESNILSNWKNCEDYLFFYSNDSTATSFYSQINSCFEQKTNSRAQLSATLITNSIAQTCIAALTVPKNILFVFTYNVDCNRFQNSLKDSSTLYDQVNPSYWSSCKAAMSDTYTTADDITFYSGVNVCVTGDPLPKGFLQSLSAATTPVSSINLRNLFEKVKNLNR